MSIEHDVFFTSIIVTGCLPAAPDPQPPSRHQHRITPPDEERPGPSDSHLPQHSPGGMLPTTSPRAAARDRNTLRLWLQRPRLLNPPSQPVRCRIPGRGARVHRGGLPRSADRADLQHLAAGSRVHGPSEGVGAASDKPGLCGELAESAGAGPASTGRPELFETARGDGTCVGAGPVVDCAGGIS